MYTHTYSKINWKGKSQPHDTGWWLNQPLALSSVFLFSLNKQTKIDSKH